MTSRAVVDGVLALWGERLFYPPNRIVRADPAPRLDIRTRRVAVIVRRRIDATTRQAPQVMVKVAGGGRGMRAIAAHFKYISRDGTLELEDDRGVRRVGKESLCDLVDQWRHAGILIEDHSPRREALHITLSMPRGTDPDLVLNAARDFARIELPDNRYVLAMHRDQAHPHVHLTVRTESRSGTRLDAWLERHRWRESFAERLRSWGVEAEATSQTLRGENRRSDPLWRARGKVQGTIRNPRAETKTGARYFRNRAHAMQAWAHIMKALAQSDDPGDRDLSERVARFVQRTPFLAEIMKQRDRHAQPSQERSAVSLQTDQGLSRSGPELTR